MEKKREMISYLKKVMKSLFDVFESFGLLCSLVFVLPLEILRRFDRIYFQALFLRFLLPRGLLASLYRAKVDEKLGNYGHAAVGIKGIIRTLEAELDPEHLSPEESRLFIELFGRLMKLQFLAGQIDHASVTVINANALTGVSCLPAYPEFDIKIAHITRAGIAAGKLLEEGGLATLMVRKSDGSEVHQKKKHPKNKKSSTQVRRDAKIIPFPVD